MYTKEVDKLNAIVESLKSDKSSNVVGGFVLYAIDQNAIMINGYSNYHFKSNITKEIAAKEFCELKDEFNQLMNEAKSFLDYAKDKVLRYQLCMDSGNGAILICEEENGKLKFHL